MSRNSTPLHFDLDDHEINVDDIGDEHRDVPLDALHMHFFGTDAVAAAAAAAAAASSYARDDDGCGDDDDDDDESVSLYPLDHRLGTDGSQHFGNDDDEAEGEEDEEVATTAVRNQSASSQDGVSRTQRRGGNNSSGNKRTREETPILSVSRRKKKPKGMPKRPLSAYNWFFQEERQRLMELKGNANIRNDNSNRGKGDKQHQEQHQLSKIGFEELAKTIGKRWKALTEEERKKYAEMANADTTRYRGEMESYNRDASRKKESKAMNNDNQEKSKCPTSEDTDDARKEQDDDQSQVDLDSNSEPMTISTYACSIERVPRSNALAAQPPPGDSHGNHVAAALSGSLTQARQTQGTHPIIPPNYLSIPPGTEITLADESGCERKYIVNYAVYTMRNMEAAEALIQSLVSTKPPPRRCYPPAAVGEPQPLSANAYSTQQAPNSPRRTSVREMDPPPSTYYAGPSPPPLPLTAGRLSPPHRSSGGASLPPPSFEQQPRYHHQLHSHRSEVAPPPNTYPTHVRRSSPTAQDHNHHAYYGDKSHVSVGKPLGYGAAPPQQQHSSNHSDASLFGQFTAMPPPPQQQRHNPVGASSNLSSSSTSSSSVSLPRPNNDTMSYEPSPVAQHGIMRINTYQQQQAPRRGSPSSSNNKSAYWN